MDTELHKFQKTQFHAFNTRLQLQKKHFHSMNTMLHDLHETHIHSMNTKLCPLHCSVCTKGVGPLQFVCKLTMTTWHLEQWKKNNMSDMTVIMNNTGKCSPACVPGLGYCPLHVQITVTTTEDIYTYCGSENRLLSVTIPKAFGHIITA